MTVPAPGPLFSAPIAKNFSNLPLLVAALRGKLPFI
jgi:hypothetical protein